jgi:hypothetical protein
LALLSAVARQKPGNVTVQKLRLTLIVALLSLVVDSRAADHRSSAARAAFKREQPCPSTGLRRGACPGYVIDHVEPLCAGGRDDPRNMQWQTVAEAKVKDREEVRMCRVRRN